MRLYYEIAVRSFQRMAVYRAAFISGMLTNAFFGAVRCFVYLAVYGSGGSVAGFTLNDAISYTWITQSLISIGAGWIATDIAGTISSGAVVSDLTRPWNVYGYWFSRFVGERAFNLLLRGTLTYAIGVALFAAHIPSPAEFLPFIVAISLAVVVSFAFTALVNLTAFWLIDFTGVAMLANVVLSFFSGFVIPIAFFPPALRVVADVLPFQAITGLPAQIFLGQIAGGDLVQALLLQLFWAAALIALGLLLLRVAIRKVVIQGG